MPDQTKPNLESVLLQRASSIAPPPPIAKDPEWKLGMMPPPDLPNGTNLKYLLDKAGLTEIGQYIKPELEDAWLGKLHAFEKALKGAEADPGYPFARALDMFK